jgi:hypothetical protein
MASSFFLSRFGLSLAKFTDDTSVEVLPIRDPPKPKKIPKISPFGFEILPTTLPKHSLDDQRVFACVDSDPEDPSSGWVNIELDEDGDPSVNVIIEDDTWLNKKMYFKCNVELAEIPQSVKSIDKDDDFIIDVTGFVQLQVKLGTLMHLQEVPENVSSIWYHYKFHCDANGKIRFRNGSSWVDMPFPIDSTMKEGFYSFI